MGGNSYHQDRNCTKAGSVVRGGLSKEGGHELRPGRGQGLALCRRESLCKGPEVGKSCSVGSRIRKKAGGQSVAGEGSQR